MIRSYGMMRSCDFPNPDVVLQTLDCDDIAVVKEIDTEYDYILTNQLRCWTQVSDLVSIISEDAEWVMAMDDFENGWGKREYPHCSNCNRGVYRHDAGSWCPFCGKSMKNPMR